MLATILLSLLAVAPRGQEGDAQAITSLTDMEGRPLADGRYSQEVKSGVLHIEARYDFPDGRTVVERAALRLLPQIVQESWDWTERKGDELIRSYEVDLRTRKAMATRMDEHKRWKEEVDVEPGKTFAGIGFVTAIKALRAQLAPGSKVELKAVAFTPKPRTVTVSVTRDGPTPVAMAGRTIRGDRYTIHAEIPAIARLFVTAPDQHVWLFGDGPAAFLRYQGPLMEPKDPIVSVDLIPAARANAQGRAGPRPKR